MMPRDALVGETLILCDPALVHQQPANHATGAVGGGDGGGNGGDEGGGDGGGGSGATKAGAHRS